MVPILEVVLKMNNKLAFAVEQDVELAFEVNLQLILEYIGHLVEVEVYAALAVLINVDMIVWWVEWLNCFLDSTAKGLLI